MTREEAAKLTSTQLMARTIKIKYREGCIREATILRRDNDDLVIEWKDTGSTTNIDVHNKTIIEVSDD